MEVIKMNKEYRFAVPATVCFSITAKTEEEALAKAEKWREELEDLHQLEGMIFDEETVFAKTENAADVAVYFKEYDEKITAENIETIDDIP